MRHRISHHSREGSMRHRVSLYHGGRVVCTAGSSSLPWWAGSMRLMVPSLYHGGRVVRASLCHVLYHGGRVVRASLSLSDNSG